MPRAACGFPDTSVMRGCHSPPLSTDARVTADIRKARRYRRRRRSDNEAERPYKSPFVTPRSPNFQTAPTRSFRWLSIGRLILKPSHIAPAMCVHGSGQRQSFRSANEERCQKGNRQAVVAQYTHIASPVRDSIAFTKAAPMPLHTWPASPALWDPPGAI